MLKWALNLKCVISKVLTVVWWKTEVFLDVMLCHWVSGSWHLKGSWCLYLEGPSSPTALDCCTLEDEGSTILWNGENKWPNDTASQLKTWTLKLKSVLADSKKAGI